MNEPFTSVALSKAILYGSFAIFGGVVHALVAQRKGLTKGLKDQLALSIISGFAGAMWILIALHFFPNDQIIHLLAGGMGGYLSTEGLAMMVSRGREFIGTIKK
jgi:hypothetical protein